MMEASANHTEGAIARGGRLWLTNQRLVFLPHGFDQALGADAVNLPLSEVAHARKEPAGCGPQAWFSGGARARLRIDVVDGTTQLFVVNRLDSVVGQIEQQIGEGGAMAEKDDGTDERRSIVLCPNCRAEMVEGSNFCHLCGTRITTPPEVAQLQPPQLPPQPPVTYVRPLKDRSMAQILEILPGLFGFLGFGWIYAGDVNTGIMFLVGYLVAAVAFVIFDIISGGICCFFTVPLQILIIAVSVSRLNQHIKAHPELFGE